MPIIFVFLFFNGFIQAQPLQKTCRTDKELLKSRSQELQALLRDDQEDRIPPVNWNWVAPRDEERRKRVAEIFAEGCFRKAKDYAAAAMIFQHGVTSDHYYQAFIWSQKALALGHASAKWLVAAAVDRYLVSVGQKQLFATQAYRPRNHRCWCLNETEESFPESMRFEYTEKGLKEAFEWVESLNQSLPRCTPARYCNQGLKPSPAGTVPGFW